MFSSVVKTACNGPANNALFVPDKERKKARCRGAGEGNKTLLVPAYIYFFAPLYEWTVLEIFVLTVV